MSMVDYSLLLAPSHGLRLSLGPASTALSTVPPTPPLTMHNESECSPEICSYSIGRVADVHALIVFGERGEGEGPVGGKGETGMRGELRPRHFVCNRKKT